VVRCAVGGQVRQEDFVEEQVSWPAQLERDVVAAYAEVLIPWVSAQNRRPGVDRLETTLAARYEEYSDFGSTFNPKIGLAWVPVEGLNVRGTWGTSFRAPLLNQLNSGNGYALLTSGYSESPTGTTTTLELAGNGRSLDPEESRNWTVGFDFTPRGLPDLSVSATYFDIHYDQRISPPLPSNYSRSGVLLDPTYDVIVTRTPDPADVAALIASAPYVYCYQYDAGSFVGSCEASIDEYASEVTAIVDTRLRNVAGVRMSGVDVSVSYRIPSTIGEWGLNMHGSQLLRNDKQLVPGAEWSSELNQAYYPVAFRLRSNLSFSRDGLSVVAAVNYIDDYRDTRTRRTGTSVQRSRVASWTTVDLTVQYELSRLWASAWPRETSLQLSASNLFDRDPPYVANADGLYYDGANANPRGRYLSAQITARW
jgi:iron complex outermembrane receptor protein